MSQDTFRERDQSCVDFVIRYKLATNQVLASQLLAGRSVNAVAKVTARLCKAQILSRYMLIPPETYFRLGTRAIACLGLSARLAEPLGPQALPTDYATLIYAMTGSKRRRRLTLKEVDEYMPWLPNDLKYSPYTVDAEGNLEMIRADLGGSPQHVARKTTAAAHERLDVPEIADLAHASRFQVVLLTTSEEKAAAIAKSLAALGCTNAVRIHIAIIRRLSLLLLRSN